MVGDGRVIEGEDPQVVRAVGCECCVSELDGIRVELARGDAVDVDGRVRLIARDPEGDRVDAGRELDGFGHLLPRVIAACRIEVHVLDELLRGLTHIEDHLVVGGVVILSGVARHKRYGAALAGVNREGDGVAVLVEVARVGAARRGVVAGEDAGAAAHARLIGFGFDARPIFRCHLRMDLLAGVLRVGSP